MHGNSYKNRWFVLARVPHAVVLIYYDRKCMDEDNILGYIDMRRVISIRDAKRPVDFDGSRTALGGLANKFKSLLSSSSNAPTYDVLELVTSNRIYTLCPGTGACPPFVSNAAAVGISKYGRPLYLFGWPFPVPDLEGAVTTKAAQMAASGNPPPGYVDGTDASEDDEVALEMSNKEALQVANDLLNNTSPETTATALNLWKECLKGVVAAEKATRSFPVTLISDSTGMLPERLILRVSPTEITMVSVNDKDVAFASIPLNDLHKWDHHADTELHITARTRARLIARPDRLGFQTQRPNRTTAAFIFKSTVTKNIVQCIDVFVKTLAAAGKDNNSLNVLNDDAEAALACIDKEGSIPADDSEELGDEDSSKAKAKLVRRGAIGATGASARYQMLKQRQQRSVRRNERASDDEEEPPKTESAVVCSVREETESEDEVDNVKSAPATPEDVKEEAEAPLEPAASQEEEMAQEEPALQKEGLETVPQGEAPQEEAVPAQSE